MSKMSGAFLIVLFSCLLMAMFGVQNVEGEPSTEGWSKPYGGGSDDMAHALVQTDDGGYAIAGYTESYGAGASDFWLVKTDASGNALWNMTYGGAGADWAEALVQTSDGGYAAAGRTASSGVGNYDFWLVKTDASGVVPEFPSNAIPIALMIAFTVTALLMKKRLRVSRTR